MPDEYLLKICMIGIPDKLKTKMIRIFTEGAFLIDYPSTLGVAVITKQIQVDGNNIKLIIVDTAGQEFFGKLRPSYYRDASAAIIIFDKSSKNSFHAVKDWYKEFKKHIPEASVPVALVGFITKSESKVDTPTFLKIQKRLENTGEWIGWANNEEINNNEEIYEEITTDEGQSLAEELGLSYYETRPTDKKIIEQIFHDLTLKVIRKKEMFNKL